jgi:hypothetical protein
LKKKPSQKRDGGVAQGVGPEFKPQYHKKKKRSTINCIDDIFTYLFFLGGEDEI